MTLGFSVEDLLPKARGGGQLRMGLFKLDESDWLQPDPDRSARAAAFAAYPAGIQLTDRAAAPGYELARMLGIDGALAEVAAARHEDICLLTSSGAGEPYRLIGAAVAWPSDWSPAEKMGLPLTALHAPIQGYAEQLATGVDRFMAQLKPGAIFGRANWFIAATGAMRWVARPPREAFAHVTAANAGETLFIRSERQTLRRLPETGAIVFTIGVYIAPLGSLSPANVQRLAAATQSLVAGEGDRRGTGAYAEALIGYAEAREDFA